MCAESTLPSVHAKRPQDSERLSHEQPKPQHIHMPTDELGAQWQLRYLGWLPGASCVTEHGQIG